MTLAAARAAWAALLLLAAASATAQVRGVYPAGMNAVNAGALPAPGVSYSNLLIVNSRDERVGPDGETVATGDQSVVLDLNTVAWARSAPLAGGARLAATATVILSKNSLTSDAEGALGEGSGLGDLFIQPVIFGWSTARADFKAAYGFVAPTGRFKPGAEDNVGAGYWTHAFSAGATLRFRESRRTAASAFVMYEVHERQEGTGVRPGDTLDLDVSLMRALDVPGEAVFQAGIVGYGQWQVSARTAPDDVPGAAPERYRVCALGLAAGVAWPGRRTSLAVRLFQELAARSTFEGVSLQVSGSIAF